MDCIELNRKQRAEALAERVKALVVSVNGIIMDIETDVAMPSEASFHAKDAYVGLHNAHLALLDAVREAAVTHYTGLAAQAAGGVA